MTRASWRARARSADSVPIEMRFIDMFMAALGALIFMTMILAFLLSFTPPSRSSSPDTHHEAPPIAMTPFSIATTSLPPGREGKPYQFAFAYRGGVAPVTWSIAAGQQEIPPEMPFDATTGVLSGTPRHSATIRFVLQAKDKLGVQARRPYEMTIEAAPTDVKGSVTRAWPIILIIVLALLCLICRSAAGFAYQRSQILREAYDVGELQVVFPGGTGESHVVRLPQGIEQYDAMLLRARGLGRLFLFAFLGVTGWLAWHSFIG